MPPSPADLLLASPLGRQVLAGYVGYGPEPPLDRTLYEQLGLAPAPGTAALTAGGVQPARSRRGRRWQDVTPAEARAVVGAAVARQTWREVLAGASESELLGNLSGDTWNFGFMGEDEAIWGLTALAADELRPVADALVSSPGARRWWDPVALADQRFVEWPGEPRLAGPAIESTVRQHMRHERAENAEGLRQPRPPEQPGVIIGAYWWSTPRFGRQTWTTTAVGGLPALALCQFSDDFVDNGEAITAKVWSTPMDPRARVLEISHPADWQDLVSRFPRDVTGTHDGEWRYWGGAAGPWLLPDWEQVMEHYDGVHVTIGGFVASCGLALPVDGGYTMLVAWLPDATLWLRDLATEVRLLGEWDGGPAAGCWDDDPPEWKPVAG